ncbi:hypothetical protein [Dyella sp. RRB7]|uniref:hypothetical protein n=1 Tax=Dyella sp. RRB7 TaxID=2919502 RepID=UPI001FAADCF9|nr:hypothetical protein [Dyella sp. RRB7]
MTDPVPPFRRNERIPPTWDGTLPFELPPRLPPSPPPPSSGYIAAHWKGELPLGQAYWFNGVLLGFALVFIESVLLEWLKTSHPSLTRVLLVAASYAVLRLVISVWQVVGILRSAALSGSRWAIVVNILMVLAIVGTLGRLPTEINQLRLLAQGAAEQRRFDHFAIAPDAAGQAIVASGTVGTGYADAIADAFSTHPSIHRLVLDSVGGDVDNGMQLHDFLVARPDIAVEVDHVCVSACTLAFIGGNQRIVSAKATLGFHQMRSMIDSRASVDYAGSAQEKFMSLLSARGASLDFIRLAFAKQGNDFYAPNADELFANHVITGLRIDDRVLTAEQWRTEQFLYSFRLHADSRRMGDALALIRQQWPAIYDAWIAHDLRIHQEPSHQQRLVDYNNALWQALHAARRAAMRTVTAEHVRHFATAQRDMLQSISTHLSADACGRYVSANNFNPRDQAEAIYMANGDSYANLLTDNDPRRAITVDEALGNRLLAEARNRVAQSIPLSPGNEFHAQLCRQQIALLDQLLALPGAGGDMALRNLFASGQ